MTDRVNERTFSESVIPNTEGCLIRFVGMIAAVALLVAALLFGWSSTASAQQIDRAKHLGEKLLCVCGCNQGLTACNHVGCQYSHAMLKELDDRVARGDSDDLILQSFVQEYGPQVLAEPPAKGFNWAAWIVPVVAPILALIFLWEAVRRWRVRSPLAVVGGPEVSPDLLMRARQESGEDQQE